MEPARHSSGAYVEQTLTRQLVRSQRQVLQRHKLAQVRRYLACSTHSGATDGLRQRFYPKANQSRTEYVLGAGCGSTAAQLYAYFRT